MWYNGNWGPLRGTTGYERVNCVICKAESKDGVHWTKPSLGLFEFKGSRDNNICDFRDPVLWSTAAVLHDEEDPDPGHRFKMVYEVQAPGKGTHFSVAYSTDGLRWKHSAANPVGPSLEMAGIVKYRGVYYVNGQGGHPSAYSARRLMTYVSTDFEHWSPCSALGLNRSPDLVGPSLEGDRNQYEQVHLGAALWNRSNVLLGVYGQWHGWLGGDRKMDTMDLGLAISHDAIHFQEPVPGFKFISSQDQPDAPLGVGQALMQGQGFENVGEQTLYWYSLWRGTPGSGVRMVSWPRDRLGMLKAFSAHGPRALTCPFRVIEGRMKVYVNASGLGQYSRLRIGLADEGCQPIRGFSGEDAAVVDADGFRIALSWKGGDSLAAGQDNVRLHVQFEGIRPEDCRLHAIYIGADRRTIAVR